MPDRPPNCRTAEIACTISEMHEPSPKLAGKRCTFFPLVSLRLLHFIYCLFDIVLLFIFFVQLFFVLFLFFFR